MAVNISISITQNSQSVANNKSNVTVKLTASWTGGSNNRVVNASGTPQANGWVKIDGTSYNFASTFNDNQTTTGSKTIFSKSLDIAHNSDGTKTLSCSASYSTGVSSGTVTTSASKTLTTIPRKSTLSVGNGKLDTAQTLTVTKQASSFTHTITAKCGTASTTICTKSTNNSISFTPPLDWAKQNTTGTSLSVTYTITTYNGSTNVGSNSYKKTCSIPSSVKPSCEISVTESTTYYSTYGAYVKGYSKLKITVTPTLAYNSPIASYKTTADGATYTSASFTTGTLKNNGTLSISSNVTDKRGRTGSAEPVKINVLDYLPPNISTLNVSRCNGDGTANDQGEYVKVSFVYSISSLNNKNSIKECVLTYKKTSDTDYITPPDFDYTTGSHIFEADSGASYDVKLSVKDNITSNSRVTSVSTAFTIRHIKANGRGVAFGKIAELDDLFDIGFATRFTGGLLYPVLEAGTDLNNIRTPNLYVGANASTSNYINCPLTSGTFTLEVLSSGESGQVMQRLTRCYKQAPDVYERFYYSGSWGNWTGGWINATLNTKFAKYGETDTKYRKCGSIVEIRGYVTPASDIAGGTDIHTIFTLPEGYRPESALYALCQGSSNCTWLLRVNTNGDVGFSRYRNGDTTTTASAGTWLPFQLTFIV